MFQAGWSCTIFREEATSTIAGVHAGPPFWPLDLVTLVFEKERKLENPEKTLGTR